MFFSKIFILFSKNSKFLVSKDLLNKPLKHNLPQLSAKQQGEILTELPAADIHSDGNS